MARRLLPLIPLIPLIAPAAWIVYSRAVIPHNADLPDAIDAERSDYDSPRAGRLAYYHDTTGAGRPLVLIHSINAAASAYELRPLFLHYRGQRPVYALELPGFGFSDRSARRYSPELYAHTILDFLADVVGQAADLVTLSLSSEFAARAAMEDSTYFRSITMISPSGFTLRENQEISSQRASDSGAASGVYRLLSFPLWGLPLYDLIASRPSLRFFLKQSFYGDIDAGLIEYDWYTAHQPGAHHAPLYFVSGTLFTRDARATLYPNVSVPTLVIYDEDAFVRFDTLDSLVEEKANWQATRITPTRGLPQFEALPQTTATLDTFWGAVS